MAGMSHSAAMERFRAEARYALERVKHYRHEGDADQADRWHRVWSLAETAADAELREKGGGARVVRLKNPPPLRPLPQGVPPLSLTPSLPQLAEVAEQTEHPSDPDPLPQALERHERIDRALREGGSNPLPDEITEEEWQYHLTAYQVGGPYDCELLQAVEDAVERIVEFRPEFWKAAPDPETAPELSATEEPLQTAALSECFRIYRESLSELSEDELRADLETCLAGGRPDTAVLIEAELAQRERDEAPDLSGIRVGECRAASGPVAGQLLPPSVPSEPASYEAASPASAEPETAMSGYTTVPDWIDTAGRTRTWSLFDPAGTKMAEICTKRDAEKLADLFNRLLRGEARLSP